MKRFLLKRALQALLVLLLTATVTFFIVRVTGDPVRAMLPPEATAQQEALLRSQLGLDRPLYQQYFEFLFGLLHLDFGQSITLRQPVFALIMQRLPNTLMLAAGATVFTLLIAVPAGMISALKRGSSVDSSVVAAVLIGQSTPAFYVGILLILLFSVHLHWLPASGAAGPLSLILPSVTLGLYSMAIVARLLRSSLIDVMSEDYIRTAVAKGLPRVRVVIRHGLRNAALPVVTVVALEVGSLIGGAVLTEQVFAWPGIGRLTVEAITNRDFPLMQGVVIFGATMYIVANFIADALYAVLDPRVRITQ